MIQAIELENFKGIAGRQRIDFSPLTLLFGANSAGKSSLLHALVYLNELLERGSADADQTELGGESLELGGFGRLVHGHDLRRAIRFRVEFDTPGGLNRFGRDLSAFPLPDLDDEVERAWLELVVAHRSSSGITGPVVQSVAVGVGDSADALVLLELASLRESEPLSVRVNGTHPLFAAHSTTLLDWSSIAVPEPVAAAMRDSSGGEPQPPPLRSDFDGGQLSLVFALSRSRNSALPPLVEPIRVLPFGDEPVDGVAGAPAHGREVEGEHFGPQAMTRVARRVAVDEVQVFLEMVVLGTVSQLSSALRNSVYLGPIRAVPHRGFLYERTGRISSWAGGLAAWDLLLGDRGGLVEATNKWLKRLGATTRIVVQHLFDRSASAEQLGDGTDDAGVRRLLLEAGSGSLVLPSEVGAGISQFVPVVVAAIGPKKTGLVMIEQPEIHVHPALQTGIGDLLIEAAQSRQLLVETHSEHLVLRLLRRIRETTAKELPAGAPALSPDKLSVLWVEGGKQGTSVRRLGVDETGEFADRWPKGFFEERAGELF
jgi:hypothetical protein